MNRLAPEVLLLGGDGMLGRAWWAMLEAQGIAFTAPSETELDLTQVDVLDTFVDDRWGTVINCAAWTDVDGAESHYAQARQINETAVGQLANRCKAVGAKFIHYSTDYVFDGRSDRPYAVDHPACPVNAYGRSKWHGEQLIRRSGCKHLLVRTSWLYAPWASHFVRSIMDLANQRSSITVVNDQLGRPTSAEHLAEMTLKLIQREAEGTFHVTDGGQCSWFQFASEIVRGIKVDCHVEPCTTERFPCAAKRPAYSVLDLSKTESLLGSMPDWTQNLSQVLQRIEPIGLEDQR